MTALKTEGPLLIGSGWVEAATIAEIGYMRTFHKNNMWFCSILAVL